MNYQRIYNQIVERAKNRKLEGYKEKHHILPKCLGGDNSKENIVELTAREHFLCHLLLVEIYPIELKLKQALWLMAIGKNKTIKYRISSRIYEYVRINRIVWWGDKISKANKGKKKPKGFGENISKKLMGTKRSDETKQKISQSTKGKVKHTQEFKDYIGGIHKNKTLSDEIIEKIKYSHIGRKASDETKLKMSKSRQNVVISNETKIKISNSMLGKKKTEEHKENIRLSRLNKPTRKATSVIQYNMSGDYIKEWNKITDILIHFNKSKNDSSITQCCRNKQKSAFGFKWKYKN